MNPGPPPAPRRLKRLMLRAGAVAGFERFAPDPADSSVEIDAAPRPGHRPRAVGDPLGQAVVLAVSAPDDAAGGAVGPAVRLEAFGGAKQVGRRWGQAVEGVWEFPGLLLTPGLVNAHVHLDLWDAGRWPRVGGFTDWVGRLRKTTGPWDPAAWAKSRQRGRAQAVAAGTAAVGDIVAGPAAPRSEAPRGGAGQPTAASAVAVGPWLGGVAFAELFGLGPPHDEAALRLIHSSTSNKNQTPGSGGVTPSVGAGGGLIAGWQPHAPYSAGPAVYAAAGAAGRAVSTHLAETLEEAEFVRRGTGPFRDLLESIGKWSPGFLPDYRGARSPVAWMEPHLRARRWLAAHVNYADDADIALLAETRTSVAYCPIASEYFGHRGHRYRDMLAEGVNVCLGTDSSVCQPPGEPQPLGVLPQMRRLYRRDGVAPETLLEMATINGWRALGQAPDLRRLCAVAIDAADPRPPLQQAMESHAPATGIEVA